MLRNDNRQQKIIVILGPTASGKSGWAVRLAKKFNGEIISADSRQVYKGMDIGTGKITPDTKNSSNFSTGRAKKKYTFTHKGIPHYCIDVASPKKRFTVAQYKNLAEVSIKRIFKKNKLPILCGGTGFYIQTVIDDIAIPEVPPDWKLRKKLAQKTTKDLYRILKKFDPKRAKTIDKNNPRRLIRAIEIVMKTKKPVPVLKKNSPPYSVLIIGIKKPFQALKKLINKRLLKRLGQGMVAEVKKMKKSGVSWQRLDEFGLEYRWITKYLQKKISYEEMVEKLQKDIEHFAKRQMTWFKRDPKIVWVKNYRDAERLVRAFI